MQKQTFIDRIGGILKNFRPVEGGNGLSRDFTLAKDNAVAIMAIDAIATGALGDGAITLTAQQSDIRDTKIGRAAMLSGKITEITMTLSPEAYALMCKLVEYDPAKGAGKGDRRASMFTEAAGRLTQEKIQQAETIIESLDSNPLRASVSIKTALQEGRHCAAR
jgi:hypothetical protein